MKLPKWIRAKQTPVRNDYLISKTSLGYGMSGHIYEGFCRTTGRKCAIKVLRDNIYARREVYFHWHCKDCKFVVCIYDIYHNSCGGRYLFYLIMECMDGGSLLQYVEDEGINEEEAANLMRQMSEAVHFLHLKNIAHRDLKPENFLFTSNGPDKVLKLSDFGFAKSCSSKEGLITRCFTPYYVAPEVISKEKYGKGCDVWSLGVILYLMLCGFPPFYTTQSQTFSSSMRLKILSGSFKMDGRKWRDVSASAKELISGMLQVDTDDRMTIAEVRQSKWLKNEETFPFVAVQAAKSNLKIQSNMFARKTSQTRYYLRSFIRRPKRLQLS